MAGTATNMNKSSRKHENIDGLDGKVWVSDGTGSFLLGRIVELSEEGPIIQPMDEGEKAITAGYDSVFPAEEDEKKDVDDNCSLMYLNEATLLNNVRLRYSRDKIYTYVANILIAVNPYFEIPNLYSSDTIGSYLGKSLGTKAPHVFAIADKAFRDMKVLKQSQSIIVSGESGAGKTESTKYILKYLCDNYGSLQSSGSLEEKILQANPILEAFGNAKTTRNNNSSRFGKFIEIHFDGKYSVVGGYISHYLLERARVISQSSAERNYHIFYQLIAGADKDLAEKLHLSSPDKFRYLAHGCTQFFVQKGKESLIPADRISSSHKNSGALKDLKMDDYSDFQTVDRDLANIGLTDGDRMSVYTAIAAVLHLGNIAFEDNPEDTSGGCILAPSSETSLQITAKLLGLEPQELRSALTSRIMQGKGNFGTIIHKKLKSSEAANARDALAKSLYTRLFDYIVMRINQSIPFSESRYYIGVLDIAGFEYFTVNSFEQFCINYCNEKLQQFFNQRILKDEQELYVKEGLGVKNVSFVDNQDCIDLIEAKQHGIFSLLDEESKLPKPNYQHFTEQIFHHNSSHFRIDLPRKSKLKEHREIRDDDGFLIRHFAGAVCYQTRLFIEKNNDALHASLEAIVQECRNPFISKIFSSGDDSSHKKGKLNFISVGSKFKKQLEELMIKLRSTGTNFIRCIKPNVKMIAHEFEAASVMSQLQCAGMTSVLELMQQGFPSRAPFSELYNMYKEYLPKDLARLDPRLFCKALFKALGLDDKEFQFGLTKVFFRPGKFAEFDQMMKSDPENLRILIGKVKKWLLCSRWRKAQWCALEVIKLKNKIIYRREALVCIQKNLRMHLAMKQHRPRYLGLKTIKTLSGQVEKIQQLGNNLKGGKSAMEQSLDVLRQNLDKAVGTIKACEKIKKTEIDKMYNSLVDQINREFANVKKKIEEERIAEEQERLRKLQEEMERERKRQEEERLRQLKMEEEKRQKQEMEKKRKEEEEEERRLEREERDKNLADVLQKQLEDANARYEALQKQMEQERRDHELALRLAAESGGGVEDLVIKTQKLSVDTGGRGSPDGQPDLNGGSSTSVAKKNDKKFDLAKWKYAELRDTINTSCDIELLEACREEFHRRLKVYHAWKAKNRKKNTTFNDSIRAPTSILEEANKQTLGTMKKPVTTCDHRYFRIPFVRPDGTTDLNINNPAHQSGRGWWYAHFDGQWIARQMELHPGRTPILLVAGKDDMHMCELGLEETGLARKRGAEILESEFDKEWRKHGGESYVAPQERRRQ